MIKILRAVPGISADEAKDKAEREFDYLQRAWAGGVKQAVEPLGLYHEDDSTSYLLMRYHAWTDCHTDLLAQVPCAHDGSTHASPQSCLHANLHQHLSKSMPQDKLLWCRLADGVTGEALAKALHKALPDGRTLVPEQIEFVVLHFAKSMLQVAFSH